jgi:hypothetical protein
MHTLALLFVVSIGATVGASVGGSGEVASGPNVNEASGEWASGDAMSGEIRLNQAGLALAEGLPSSANAGAPTPVSTTQTSAADEDSGSGWVFAVIIAIIIVVVIVWAIGMSLINQGYCKKCTGPLSKMCCPGTTTKGDGRPRDSTGMSLVNLQPTTLPTLINLQAKTYKHVSATPPGSSCDDDDDEVW